MEMGLIAGGQNKHGQSFQLQRKMVIVGGNMDKKGSSILNTQGNILFYFYFYFILFLCFVL